MKCEFDDPAGNLHPLHPLGFETGDISVAPLRLARFRPPEFLVPKITACPFSGTDPNMI